MAGMAAAETRRHQHLYRLLRQIRQPLLHPRAGLGGGLEDADARPDLVDIPERQLAVEAAGLGDIDLGDHRRVGGVEERGILERLVFALGHAEQGHANLSPRS
jgi:hypothetical protein